MKHLMLLPALALAASLSAQTSPGTTTTPTTRHARTAHRRAANTGPTTQQQIDQLKQLLEQQQQQLSQLQQQLSQRDQQLQAAQQQVQTTQQAAQTAQSAADQANQKAEQANQSIQAANQQITDVKTAATNTNTTIQEEQKRIGSLESPLAIHYKGITITPGGFLAAETIWRQRALAADVDTPFNALPLGGNNAAHQSEIFGSGRQSRLTMLAEGKYKFVKATGYVEGDFLSAGVTSNNNETNSYTFRMRQLYAQAALDNGWTFTGGQMWSLVTEYKKGLENRQEALAMMIDPQYIVGFSWARQYGFRATKNFHNKFYLGASVENSQVTLTSHGNAANFNIGAPGTLGGLFNNQANYSFNKMPDFVVKAAIEPGWGHYEVFGLVTQARARVFPNATLSPASGAGAFNTSTTGGGGGFNARGLLANKHVELGIHFLGGKGIGRYGTTGQPNATVQPNGQLQLLTSMQGLATIELHSNHWDWYNYVGSEYVGRGFGVDAAGKPVGYGSPLFNNTGCLIEVAPAGGNGFTPGVAANCTGDTHNMIEGSTGFWYKFYTGPKGRLQFGPQYAYVVRDTWSGLGGQPHSVDNMVWTSFRYYLP